MPDRRWVSLSLLVVLAGAWSVSLGVLGLWLIAQPHSGLLGNGFVATSAGLIMLCAAQLVFLRCVTDRLFPSPGARLHAMLTLGNAAILTLSTGVLITATLIASV